MTMPRLACMSEVTDRRLGFAEAMNGEPGPDGKSLSVFDRKGVRKGWTSELPETFAQIPGDWLPQMTDARTGTRG